MSLNHQPADDQSRQTRWTAYALDQLDAAERRIVEAEVGASDEARQYVAGVRALARQVRATARQEAEAIGPSKALREAVEQRLSQKEVAAMEAESTKPQAPGEADASPAVKTRWTRRRWIALAAAACLLMAVVVPTWLVLSSRDRDSTNLAMDDVLHAKKSASAELHAGPTRYFTPRADAEPGEKAAAPLRDEEDKFNTDRSKFRGTEPTRTEGLEGSRSGQGAGEATPSEKAHHRDYLKSVHRLIEQQKELPEPSAPRPEAKPAPRAKPSPQPAHRHSRGDASIRREPASGRPVAKRVPQPVPGERPQDYQLATPVYETRTRQRDAERLMQPGPGVDGPGPGVMSGKAPGTEQYDPIVENSFLSVAEQAQSTFSIDVDTASYANVRRFLTHGTWPPPNAVRIEEMVNYFKYDYPLPQGEAPFSVDMEVAQCPWNPGHRLLRVGLKGQEMDRQQRGLSNLVFLLDVSGSMASQNKLALVKQAMRLLVEQLDENDRVAIVTYASKTGVHLESTNGENRDRIVASIESLSAGGSTNGGAGIQLAYEQAVRYFIKEGTNRVILCTDGDLNVGITRDDDLVRLIEDRARSGVFLTVLGFGTGNLKDSKLEKLADHGNGLYAYVDSLREAQKVLVEQLTGSLITIAKDVKLQIEFNPAEVHSYRLVGYENRVMAARDFHDDKKDAGEIGAGHTVTALYELVPARAGKTDDAPGKGQAQPAGKLKYQRGPAVRLTEAAGSGELLTLSLRYKEPEAEQSKLLEFVARDSDKRIGEASKDFQFASSVAAFGMILRNSQHRGQATLSAVEEIAASALGDDPGGYRAEFVELVRRARQLRR